MRRLTLKREVNGVGTGCAGDIDQLGGVLRLVVMRVFLTGTQHLTHRDSGAGCARQETLAPMKNDTPNNSPGEPSTIGGSEFMKAPVEVQRHDTEAQLIDASRNPPSTPTATSDGPVRKPSESTGPGEKPAVETSGFPSDIPEEELHDEMLIIRRILAVIDAQSLAIQRKLRRKAASQSWPWTSGTRERTNG